MPVNGEISVGVAVMETWARHSWNLEEQAPKSASGHLSSSVL